MSEKEGCTISVWENLTNAGPFGFMSKNRIFPGPFTLRKSTTSTTSEESDLEGNNNIQNNKISSENLKPNKTNKDFINTIRHEVNFFFEFKVESLQQEFTAFGNRHGKGRSGDFLMLTLLIVTLLLVPQSIVQLHFTIVGKYANASINALIISILSAICILLCCIVGWMIYFQDRLFLLPCIHSSMDTASTHSETAGVAMNNNDMVHLASLSDEEIGGNIEMSRPSLTTTRTLSPTSISLPFSFLLSSRNQVNPTDMNDNPISSTKLKYGLILWLSKLLDGLFIHRPTISKRHARDILNSCFVMQLQFFFILQFIRLVFHLNCFIPTFNETHVWYGFIVDLMGNDTCYESVSHDVKIGFLSSQSLQLFIFSFISFKGVPQTPIRVIWFNYVVAVITFLTTIVIDSTYQSLPSGIVWMILTFFAIRDFQVRNMIIFLSTRNVKETMVSKNKALEENHANEMRSLIANVAHDLKTVSITTFFT